MLPEPMVVTLQVIETFEEFDIPYLIGGSLASGLHGAARSTIDADLVADIRFEHTTPLVEKLQPDFYIDGDMIRDAIEHQSSFNLIHLETAFKIDVFVLESGRFDQVQFQRRQLEVVSEDPERKAHVTTAKRSPR